MSEMRALVFWAVLVSAAADAQAAIARPVVITDVTIIDTGGGPAQPHRTVTVRDGRIASVEASGGPVPRNADVVDGRGRFLIPGLWDMHVHLSWTTASAMPVMVANGITSVRDMGGRLGEIDDWRTRAATGILAGPRIFRAGPILNGKSFNPLQMVPGTPDETRGVVRGLKAAGVDFLKIHRRLPRDSYFALVDEAKKQELMVVGHIPMTVTPEEASDAGQATFEHTETLFEGTFSAALPDGELLAAIRRFRAEGADALFARFVKNGTIVTPTLIAYGSIVAAMDPARHPDPLLRYVAASLKAEAAKTPMTVSAAERASWNQQFAELREVVRHLHRSGVALMTGTDVAGPRVPGFPLHEELALLVDAGLTPLQALQASTTTPARLLKKTADMGTIESGKLADLVLLDADPLQDIRNTRRIAAVVLAGRPLRRADLDALLRDAETLAGAN